MLLRIWIALEIILLLSCCHRLWAQEGRGDIRFVFYNVENLFDPFDDSLSLDEEFLPGGIRHWTWDRFLEKERRIYKVLASSGGWSPPEIIGLCEVENRFVLNWLIRKTPLLKYNYRVIHRDSPDERGIDLALLYLPQFFKPLFWNHIPVTGGRSPTRDILHVVGSVLDRDTIHLILCHWPSRWSGYLESQPDRLAAARIVKRLTDSVFRTNPAARVLLAGDMNDELSDPSLSGILGIKEPGDSNSDTCLNNLRIPGVIQEGEPWAYQGRTGKVDGTIKYQGKWYEFDHIFVSGSFISDTNLFIDPGGKRIFAPGFLLENDASNTGVKPFRTYIGYRYNGGYSDHLPIYIDIWRKQ